MKLESSRGFTLTESVIAIGVVAVLLTTFLAVFGPATQGISRAIGAEDANRLVAALETELSVLREGESDDHTTAFDKAFNWIGSSGNIADGQGIFLFNYKGDPTQIGEDGRMLPTANSESSNPDTDYVLTPMVSNDLNASADFLGAVSGPVFLVKTYQLVYNNGGGLEIAGTNGQGINPPKQGQESLSGTGSDAYPEAVIAFRADFYRLRSNSQAYLNDLDASDLERPIFERNLAVRR